MADLLTYEAALEIVLSKAPLAVTETAPLEQLLGRVLSNPIVAPIDLPPFDNSAVDGYAINALERNGEYRVIDIVPAGSAKQLKVDPGEAVRIYTGSPLPFGTTSVVMQEEVQVFSAELVGIDLSKAGDHIRGQGEELRQGSEVFPAGTRVTPPTLGALATLGISKANVAKVPRVTVIGTGSELVSPGEQLRPGQVFESNTFGVQAALATMGIASARLRVKDDEAQTKSILSSALPESDVVIVCGGVSVGDYDLVRPTLEKLGVQEHVWRVKIKPGKPFYFGTLDEKMIFGLPGNPVSALVVFTLFVRPALLKYMGARPDEHITLPAAHDFPAAKGRDEFVRARITPEGQVESLEAQGSHMLTGLAYADALVRVPADQPIAAGKPVRVHRLYWK